MLRLDSQLDDKKAWLSSLAQAIIGKSLETIKDEDEFILYDKFKRLILELNNLNALSEVKINREQEEIIGVEMSSFTGGVQKQVIRLPKTKEKAVADTEKSIRMILSNDKSINIAAVTNILKELLH